MIYITNNIKSLNSFIRFSPPIKWTTQVAIVKNLDYPNCEQIMALTIRHESFSKKERIVQKLENTN